MKSKSVEREFYFLKDNSNEFSFSSLKSEPFINNLNNFDENDVLIDKNYILKFFKHKKIYIEIYNEGENDNKSFNNLLIKYGIKPKQKLSKDLDYIIFKDGLIKTQKFSIENEVKLVNPLWLHDKLIGNFKEDEKYLIKKKYSELNIDEKINNLIKNTNKNKSWNIKRKKSLTNFNKSENEKKHNLKDKKLNSFFSESKILVNTLSYKINKQEYIEFLQTKDFENKFKYNGNIENENDESKNEYLKNTKVIFVDKEYDKYDYKIVEFIYKNIFLINLNIFTSQIILNDMQEIVFKIKDFEEFQINKNIKNYNNNNNKNDSNNYCFYIDNLLDKNEFI